MIHRLLRGCLVVALLCCAIQAVSADDVTQIWSKAMGTDVSAVAVDEYGAHLYVGYTVGGVDMLGCYDATGTILWNTTTNGTVEKIVCGQTGQYVAAITDENATEYWLGVSGVPVNNWTHAVDIQDIAMSRDGTLITVAYTDNIYVYNSAGTQVYGPIPPADGAAFDKVAVDPDENYFVASDATNVLRRYEYATAPTNTTVSLTGNVQQIDLPESGSRIAISTASNVYTLDVGSAWSSSYSAAASTGTSRSIAAVDSAAFYIETRDLVADIYRLDGTAVGTYTCGGNVTSVDVSQKNGLWAVAGGLDGSVYVFSKQDSSTWYLFDASESDDPVTSLAMTWRGEYIAVGRSDGTFALYTTSETATSGGYYFLLYIWADGTPYVGASVTVEEGGTDMSSWDPYTIAPTDNEGKIAIAITPTTYYRYNVTYKGVVYSKTLVASSDDESYFWAIKSPAMAAQVDFEVFYDETTGTINMTYTDVIVPSSVSYTIYRTDTDTVVYNQVWTGTNSISTYYAVPANATAPVYNVKLVSNRTPGTITNTWPIVANEGPVPGLPMTVYERNAIFTIFLMAMAGLGGRMHSAKLAFAVGLTALFLSFLQYITLPFWMPILVCLFSYLYMAGGEKD